jgi:hypothetical protein
VPSSYGIELSCFLEQWKTRDVALLRSGIRFIANTPTLFRISAFSVVQYGLLVSWYIGGRKTTGKAQPFFNTEITEFTENHPAHFDNTDAASRQLMTRNLRTITSHLTPAILRAPPR